MNGSPEKVIQAQEAENRQEVQRPAVSHAIGMVESLMGAGYRVDSLSVTLALGGETTRINVSDDCHCEKGTPEYP